MIHTAYKSDVLQVHIKQTTTLKESEKQYGNCNNFGFFYNVELILTRNDPDEKRDFFLDCLFGRTAYGLEHIFLLE